MRFCSSYYIVRNCDTNRKTYHNINEVKMLHLILLTYILILLFKTIKLWSHLAKHTNSFCFFFLLFFSLFFFCACNKIGTTLQNTKKINNKIDTKKKNQSQTRNTKQINSYLTINQPSNPKTKKQKQKKKMAVCVGSSSLVGEGFTFFFSLPFCFFCFCFFCFRVGRLIDC